jgi:hypothetical protein
MDIIFDSATQYLEFKQVYLDKMEIIYVYKGLSSPTYTIDPSDTSQELRENYWNNGLAYLFDIKSL